MYYPDLNDEETSPYQQAYEQAPASPYQGSYGQASASPSPTPGPTPPATPPPPAARPTSGRRRWGTLLFLAALLVVLNIGLFAGWQLGKSSTARSTPNNSTLQTGTAPTATVPQLTGSNIDTVREAVIAKVQPAVVQVNVASSNGAAIGSGVIIDRRGYIITNDHVIAGANTIQVVLFDGTRLAAQIAGADPADDLALLKVTPPAKGLTVAVLGDSSKLQVGQDVLAIGNPLGITQTVTNGIISALNRTVSEGQNGATLPDAIQTDAPINPGNSGGALVDLQGNLIGIPTLGAIDPEFRTPANGVGFAIPSNRVKFIAQQIIATGQVTHTGRAVLGIQAIDVDPTIAAQDNLSVNYGVLIANVTPNSGADQAGLRPGDVIVKIDNQVINDTSSLTSVLDSKNPGDKVSVTFYRGSQQLTVTATLGELQAG